MVCNLQSSTAPDKLLLSCFFFHLNFLVFLRRRQWKTMAENHSLPALLHLSPRSTVPNAYEAVLSVLTAKFASLTSIPDTTARVL